MGSADEPVEHRKGDTSIGLLGGTRILYDPALARYAAGSAVDDPLRTEAPAGVALLAPFSYWSRPSLKFALELGWARNIDVFSSGRTLTVDSLTATFAAHWLPWPAGRVWPYLGVAGGYFLSLSQSGSTRAEDSGWGAGLVCGAGVTLGSGLTLLTEVRALVAPEAHAAVGGVQPGGLYLVAGFSYDLAPELRPGEPAGNW